MALIQQHGTSDHMVSRNIHQMTLKAPKAIQSDSMVDFAIFSFGFLLGMTETINFTEFADRIEGYSSSPQAKALSNHLRTLSVK